MAIPKYLQFDGIKLSLKVVAICPVLGDYFLAICLAVTPVSRQQLYYQAHRYTVSLRQAMIGPTLLHFSLCLL